MKKKALNFNTRKNAIIIGSVGSGCHHPWDNLKPYSGSVVKTKI